MLAKINRPSIILSSSPLVIYHNFRRLLDSSISWIKPFLIAKNVRLAVGVGLTLIIIGYAVSFFWPRSVTFSYAGNNCFTNPVLLPRLISKNKSPTYAAKTNASISVAGYPLYSQTTCITPTEPPKENAHEVINFGVTSLLKKNIKVSSKAFPTLASRVALEKPISTQDPLILKLDSADRFFEYRLLANSKSLDCSSQHNSVKCDVTKLNLAQSAKYDVTLERTFDEKPVGTVFKHAVTTVETVHITASSIAAEQIVYDVPSEITFTLNRSVISMENARLYIVTGDTRQEVAASISLDNKTLKVSPKQPLARSASFVFSVDNIKAADGGFLSTPFSLAFKTSGGPKVLGINIGTYKVSPSGSVVITFDSPVSSQQALGDFIRLEAGGSAVAATISTKNNTVTIKPLGSLPRCSALTVKVLDGLQNNFGISGGSAWQYKSRTICQTVFSIGTSVQGRSINAYSFGGGSSKIIFVGTTHGDEKSSTYLLNSWIDYLEANGNIPAHRTIVVIPNLNPDGYALNRRTNANNVDLNRNFPANDWKSGVTMPDQTYNASGGGSASLSEPESSALANYILGQNPRLVLTYHAVAGIVNPNESGDSVALAQTYDQKSNVNFASNSATSGIFHYDTTGSFEAWLHDKHNIPALLVELWTKSGNEFSKHQNAMWAMVQLP